ncbi:MAG TPA: arsenite methyltransferase [Candidatus Saccharicenans sp.]|nr:arsenite methyltransferase [Candidatus Saccharicenans sp.]HQM74918.1 arsenite methyltransferase [Candidatus Saccharicenans sp.]
MNKEEIKKQVRKRYGQMAATGSSCCGTAACGCGQSGPDTRQVSQQVGYDPDDLTAVPADSNLGLGCGNPAGLAELKPGETVLDLGSGPGLDCFLASRRVGPEGRVIGVDMTPEMLDRARATARQNKYSNVEFRLGEIENLPVADGSVDVIISNCVINLSPDKPRVFKEAFRVLKDGGRLIVSDLVLTRALPENLSKSKELYAACVAGAVLKDDYIKMIRQAGFKEIKVIDEKPFPAELIMDLKKVPQVSRQLKISEDRLVEALNSVISVTFRAVK